MKTKVNVNRSISMPDSLYSEIKKWKFEHDKEMTFSRACCMLIAKGLKNNEAEVKAANAPFEKQEVR